MLGMGADLLQNHAPINDINMYLNGFHFYADDMGRQIEAHHYCTHINEEFFQCVIYDNNKSGSRLIGIEYIVSERIFKDRVPLRGVTGVSTEARRQGRIGQAAIGGSPTTGSSLMPPMVSSVM